MKSVKGRLEVSEPIELIIALAGIFAISLLFFKFLAPTVNVAEETSQVYFDFFREELALADSGEKGSFYMVQKTSDYVHYLVYFGEASSKKIFSETFLKPKETVNICICYVGDDIGRCEYCTALSKPVSFNENIEDTFYVGLGEELQMSFDEDKGYYNFKTGDLENV